MRQCFIVNLLNTLKFLLISGNTLHKVFFNIFVTWTKSAAGSTFIACKETLLNYTHFLGQKMLLHFILYTIWQIMLPTSVWLIHGKQLIYILFSYGKFHGKNYLLVPGCFYYSVVVLEAVERLIKNVLPLFVFDLLKNWTWWAKNWFLVLSSGRKERCLHIFHIL